MECARIRRRAGVLAVTSILMGLAAQPTTANDSAERPYWKRNLFKRFASDQGYLWRTWSPAEARRLSFSIPLLASVAVASGSSQSGIDLEAQRSFEEWARPGHAVASGLTQLGESETAIVLVGGTYLIARWTGHDRMSRATSLSAEALLNSALYGSLLKTVSQRSRPAHGGTGEFFLDRAERGQEPTSFPSGHAMGAFSVAAVFAGEYADRRWVPWLVYGTAGLIGASRVALGRHFPSDVAVGALLGHSLGKMVLTRSGGREGEGEPGRFEPILDSTGRGFGIAYSRSW